MSWRSNSACLGERGTLVSGLAAVTQQSSNSAAGGARSRLGLVVKGFTYRLVGDSGPVGSSHARSRSTGSAADRGAPVLRQGAAVGERFGFASYPLLRLTEAAAGTAAEDKKAGPRIQSQVRGIVYAEPAMRTFSFIAGIPACNRASCR